jgi:hypothetical protein
MKNLTISLDEESYRAARLAAAERDTSISSLVRDYFRALRPGTQDENVRRLFEAMDQVKSPISASSRERDRSKLYAR